MSDKNLVRALNSLWSPDQRKTLKAVEPRGAILGKRVAVTYQEPAAGGGIDSPLTETDYGARQHFAEKFITSTDGLLAFKVKVVKEITFNDANAREVKLVLDEPVVTP